jgi:hypothetical protein
MSGGGFMEDQESSSVALSDDLFDERRPEFPFEKRGGIAGIGGRLRETVLVKLDTRKCVLSRWRNHAGLPELDADGLTKQVGSMGGDEGRGRGVALEPFEVEILSYVKDQGIAFDAGRGGFAEQSPSSSPEDLTEAPEECRPYLVESIGRNRDRGLRCG